MATTEAQKAANREKSLRYYHAHREAVLAKDKTPEARAAAREHSRRYRATNPEKVRASEAAYNAANHDKQIARYKRYREATTDKRAAYKEANREQISEQSKEYYRRRGQFVIRMRQYGLTQERFEAMLEEQANACAICHMEFGDTKADAPHVDHDHASGRVRVCFVSTATSSSDIAARTRRY